MKTIAIVITLLFSLAAFASPLSDAKAAGTVKELNTGYIAATGKPSKATAALVADINKRRKAAYAKIAAKNNITVEQVGIESYKRRNP